MNKSESKYFSTAARMDEAFLELIEKKDFSYITVKEICEKAGVNRSTFYLHYETIGDLLTESTEYIIRQFESAMPQDATGFLEKLQARPLENCSSSRRNISRPTLPTSRNTGVYSRLRSNIRLRCG